MEKHVKLTEHGKIAHDSPFHPHLLCAGRMKGWENEGYRVMNAEKVELDAFWGKPQERRTIDHTALTLFFFFTLTISVLVCVCTSVFTFPNYNININAKTKQIQVYLQGTVHPKMNTDKAA